MTEFVSQLTKVGPKGMPIVNVGKSVERLYQKISCTSSGVPRKNQMNSEASVLASLSFDMRAIAKSRPKTMPSAMATTVRPSET